MKSAIRIICLLVVTINIGVAFAANNIPMVASFGANGTGEELFLHPYGLSVDAVAEHIYVADTGNNRIKKFDKFGNYIDYLGGVAGGGAGEFRSPQGSSAKSVGSRQGR